MKNFAENNATLDQVDESLLRMKRLLKIGDFVALHEERIKCIRNFDTKHSALLIYQTAKVSDLLWQDWLTATPSRAMEVMLPAIEKSLSDNNFSYFDSYPSIKKNLLLLANNLDFAKTAYTKSPISEQYIALTKEFFNKALDLSDNQQCSWFEQVCSALIIKGFPAIQTIYNLDSGPNWKMQETLAELPNECFSLIRANCNLIVDAPCDIAP